MKIIALMGPSRGGKSSIAAGVAERLEGRIVRLSFADALKEQAAAEFGYTYEKTNEQREILQKASAKIKGEKGEDVFSKGTLTKLYRLAENRTIDFAIIDDLRHCVERSDLIYAHTAGMTQKPLILNVTEAIAEEAWHEAFERNREPNDQYAWATHRSELEWRGFRNFYAEVANIKTMDWGLNSAISSVLDYLQRDTQEDHE